MKADRLALVGSSCWNRGCPGYGKVDHGNIVRYGRTAKGTQRLRCNIWDRVFVGNRGTVFYGMHHNLKDVLECFAVLAERNGLADIHRSNGSGAPTPRSCLVCKAPPHKDGANPI
jgi:hypothetical protein